MQFEKVHPIDPQEYATHNMAEESKVSDAMGFIEHIEAHTDLDRVLREEVNRSLDIRCLQDLLTESQSDAPISEDSCNGGSADEDEYEVISVKRTYCSCIYCFLLMELLILQCSVVSQIRCMQMAVKPQTEQ